jgi:hypothetical protein
MGPRMTQKLGRRVRVSDTIRIIVCTTFATVGRLERVRARKCRAATHSDGLVESVNPWPRGKR